MRPAFILLPPWTIPGPPLGPRAPTLSHSTDGIRIAVEGGVAVAATPTLDTGVVVGEYAIDSRLEARDNAVCYLARHQQNHTWHLLKVIDTVDPRKRLRLEQEAVFRDTLRHPNIVPATACIDIDGRPALVTEFVEGPSMEVWLAEASRPLHDKLALFRGILEGVRHAHANQVVHRGLTPSNVLLQPGPGDTWIPRISDFGLAKALSPEMGRFGGLTTINTGLGTPGYAAPEQVRDATAVTPAADLYSLGCILYELVCGVAPFTGMSAFATMSAQSKESYPPPASVAPGLPAELYELLHTMLAADPTRRPADCEQVIHALDRIYEQVAPPPSLARVPSARGRGAITTEMSTEGQIGLDTVLLLCAIPLVGLVIGAAVVFAP